MTRIKELFLKYKEVIVYVVFGVLTTIINLVVFVALEYAFGSGGNGYIVYNVIAWLVSVIFAYITNKLYVFKSRSWSHDVVIKESTQFLLARVFSFLVEEVGLILMVEVLNFGEYSPKFNLITLSGESVAKTLLLIIVIVMNYFFSKFIVFKK